MGRKTSERKSKKQNGNRWGMYQDDRWTHRSTEWQPPNGKRRGGWPTKRWRDEITTYMGTATWARVV